MGQNLSQSQTASDLPGDLTPRAKYRIRFRKAGDLRLVSHHDLMHCFERMFRRARLPFSYTQGFHPHARMTFAQALALGTPGLAEVLEVELAEYLPAEEVQARLVAQSPAGIELISVLAIDFRRKASARRAFVQLPIDPAEADDLTRRCAELLNQEELWIERTRPRPRQINLRPYIHSLTVADGHLHLVLWITPNGSARPEEVAHQLGLEAHLSQGAHFERTYLELADELPEDSRDEMPELLAEQAGKSSMLSRPVNKPNGTKTQSAEPATKSGSPHSLIDNPLSFDS